MVLPWTKLVAQRVAGKETNVPWWVNDKFKLHEFCQKNGFPMPELKKVWTSPDQLDLTDAPSEFVLKPSVMHSAWGVMVLSRLDDGRFYESLSGRTLSRERIHVEQASVYEKCKYKGSYRLFIEEKVVSDNVSAAIPFDYKVYCFHETVALVQQLDRNTQPTSMCFFDASFRTLELEGRIESDWRKYKLGEPTIPERWEELLEIASKVTSALSTPFMRVDMFSSKRGPLIGELTPAPGGAYYGETYRFTDAFDQWLGDKWAEAEERIAKAGQHPSL